MERRLKFFETLEFHTIQAKWYGILKENDFEDHETLIKHEMYLKKFNLKKPDLKAIEKMQYLESLKDLSQNSIYLSKRDQKIMQMYCEGHTKSEIAIKVKCHRQTVRYTIRKYENLWGIRFWKKSQMTSNQVIR